MEETNLHLLKEAKQTVSNLLQTNLNKNITFHTFEHTMEVLAACETIAKSEELSENDQLALFLAACFHDTGYVYATDKNHEEASIQEATKFLSSRNVDQDLTNKVIGCIRATGMPQKPTNLIEEIICDADLFHLGTNTYKEKTRLLREEIKRFEKEDISKKDWRQRNIAFLEAHQYFTDYGKKILQPVKEDNLASLQEKKHGENSPLDSEHNEINNDYPDEINAQEGKSKKVNESQTERGINTVFRIMTQNQNNLSRMADEKAHIMISVNTIVLSIVISNLFNKLSANLNLLIPFVLFVIVCLLAIIFSILATRPNVTSGKFTQDDIQKKRTNLLFFGNFHKMSLQDYNWAMQEMLNDKNYLYSSIVKDTYFLGVVLAKKYRFLRLAYTIFMYGLVLTMIAFVIAFIFPSTGYLEEYIKG